MGFFAVAKLVNTIFQVLYFALIIRVVLSWIPHNHYHPIIQFIERVTDPLLRPFQNLVPAWRFGIDLSPIFAFVALSIAQRVILGLLV